MKQVFLHQSVAHGFELQTQPNSALSVYISLAEQEVEEKWQSKADRMVSTKFCLKTHMHTYEFQPPVN